MRCRDGGRRRTRGGQDQCPVVRWASYTVTCCASSNHTCSCESRCGRGVMPRACMAWTGASAPTLAQRPELVDTQEMLELTTDLYMVKLTLDVNSHRVALQKFKEHSASEKDAADVAHIKNVQATQSLMQISDVVVVPPATGGLTAPEGIHWPAGQPPHRKSASDSVPLARS